MSVPDDPNVGCWSTYSVWLGGLPTSDPLGDTITIESLCYATSVDTYPYLWRGLLTYRIDGTYIYLLTRYEIVDDGGIHGTVPESISS